jgi:predicted Zn-dependent protease
MILAILPAMRGNSALSGSKTGVIRSARSLWPGLLVLTLLAGCTGNPKYDSHGEVELSESQRLALEFEQSIGFVDDPELQAYIESIGNRIAAQGQRGDVNFQFKILDMPVPNALALPDGQIYVSRGMLVLVNTEDELAGMLAHEIAHLEGRHADERKGLTIVTSPIRFGTGIAGWATGLIIPGLGAAIVELGESTSGLVLAPYSRGQEREADRVGQSLAAAAGYQPAGLANLLDTMANAEALDPGNAHEQEFFDSHPATAERVAFTSKHAESLTPAVRPESAREREDVIAMLQGLVIGEDPAKGFFDENWFVHPELAFVMSFPPDWEGINSSGFVGATAANKETYVMLALLGEGTDPITGAKAASLKLDTDLVEDARRGTVNGLPAAKNRMQFTGGKGEIQQAELTWIAYGGLIYQIMAVATLERFEAVAAVMRRSAHSFRPLSDEERAQIRITQLQILTGERGETLSEFAERVETPWSSEAISVVNRKPATATLEAGELMKVGIERSYATRLRPAARASSQPTPVNHPSR